MSRSSKHAPDTTHSANAYRDSRGDRPGRPHRWSKRGKGWHKMLEHVRLRNSQSDYVMRTGQKRRDGRKPKEKK